MRHRSFDREWAGVIAVVQVSTSWFQRVMLAVWCCGEAQDIVYAGGADVVVVKRSVK